jgi:hypothetical protein
MSTLLPPRAPLAAPPTPRNRDLASDEGPIFATVAKLVEALKRCIPEGTENAERKREALRLARELLRGTKYEEESKGGSKPLCSRLTGDRPARRSDRFNPRRCDRAREVRLQPMSAKVCIS